MACTIHESCRIIQILHCMDSEGGQGRFWPTQQLAKHGYCSAGPKSSSESLQVEPLLDPRVRLHIKPQIVKHYP